MENAIDALKMAAAVLAFVIAIGTSFSLFGTAKQTADSIIAIGDRQSYLEPAILDNIEYLSSDKISQLQEGESISSIVSGLTTQGDRIVGKDDVFSTIYRYAIENYSVTIINKDKKVIARYDTNLESYIKNYNYYENIKDENDKNFFQIYKENVINNIKTSYCDAPKFEENKIENLYKMQNGQYNALWLGNIQNIYKRINSDISGKPENINGIEYVGKKLEEILENKKIVEVINEIDNTKYVQYEEDGESIQTNLPQQYNMPTIEIIYIILD